MTQDASQLNILDYSEPETVEVESVAPADKLQPKDTKPAADLGTDLAVITSDIKNPVVVFSEKNGLDPFIQKLRERIKSEGLDASTVEGRKRIGSVARQIGTAKMDLARMAANLTEDWRTKTKAVTSETSRMEKELDALRDEVLRPRDEFEKREAARVLEHETRLETIQDLAQFPGSPVDQNVEDLDFRYQKIESITIGYDWQEFAERANSITEKALADLHAAKVAKVKYDKDQADLQRLRDAEEAERQKQEREQIERDARENTFKALIEQMESSKDYPEDYGSDRLGMKVEALDKIFNGTQWMEKQAQATEVYSRVRNILQNAYVEKINSENAEIERVKQETEQKRVDGIKSAIKAISDATVPEGYTSDQVKTKMSFIGDSFNSTNWQEFSNEAESARDAKLAELQKVADERKAKEDKDQADRLEVVRQQGIDAAKKEQERLDKEAEDAANLRKADEDHRRKLNNEAADKVFDTMMGSVVFANDQNEAREMAKEIIKAIALNKILHVSIKY